MRAHLVGGIPRTEVQAKATLFTAHGLNPADLLTLRDDHFFDFAPHLQTKASLKTAVETNPGLKAREAAIKDTFEHWWQAHSARITDLAMAGDNPGALVALRHELLTSFADTLEQLSMLDPFQIRGIIAQFWNASRYDFLTVMARGTKGVADAWRTSIVTALEDKGSKDSPLDHKLVQFLMGGFVAEIAELEAKKAELDAQIKAATATPEEGDDEGDEAEPVDAGQIKAWKADLAAVKKALKVKQDQFTTQINRAVDGLTPQAAGALLLDIMHRDMEMILNRYVAMQRGQIVAAFGMWWDKYRVTLTEMEAARAEATGKLVGFLKGLGYV